ncbi:hypothetical protein ACLK2H_16875 [Escherichia coli]
MLPANGHVINRDPYQYFTMTESAEQELIKATNEMDLTHLPRHRQSDARRQSAGAV